MFASTIGPHPRTTKYFPKQDCGRYIIDNQQKQYRGKIVVFFSKQGKITSLFSLRFNRSPPTLIIGKMKEAFYEKGTKENLVQCIYFSYDHFLSCGFFHENHQIIALYMDAQPAQPHDIMLVCWRALNLGLRDQTDYFHISCLFAFKQARHVFKIQF